MAAARPGRIVTAGMAPCWWSARALALVLLVVPAKADPFDRTLKGGWYLWDPYQYLQDRSGDEFLTGLDVELMRAIASEAGYRIEQHPVPWTQHIEDLRTGVRDICFRGLADPAHAPLLAPVANGRENFIKLMAGQIDGFLADRLVGATTAWRGGWSRDVVALPAGDPGPIHLMFNKASVPDATVAAFDAAIDHVFDTGVRPQQQDMHRSLLAISDALRPAAFIVIGVAVTVGTQARPTLALGVMAMVTGAGGGILRDIVRLRGDIAVPRTRSLRRGRSRLLWHIPSFRPNELLPAVVAVVAGGFVTRMAAVHFRLQSPLFSRLATRDGAPSVTLRQTKEPD